MTKLKIDSPFFRWMGRLGDVAVLNLLWLLASLPVVTLGASTAALYQLINTRLAARRSTVISTNLDFESLRRRYGAQIASRLEGEYTCLPFRGRDIRLVKKEREA